MLQKVLKHAREGTLVPTVKNKVRKRMGLNYDMGKVRDEIETVLRKPDKEAIQSTEAIIRRFFRRPLNKKYGLPQDYLSWLSNLIVTRRSYDRFSHDSYNEILERTKELSTELMASDDWKNLCHLSILTGLFQLGGVARDKAIESAYLKAVSSSATLDDIKDAFKAAVDQGDFGTASKLLSLIEKQTTSGEEVNSYYLHYYLLKGERGNALKLAQSLYNEVDVKYAEYLNGKTVAVVGPAPSDEDVVEEIDSNDIVIRLNYRSAKYMPDASEFGSKINVSYYNGDNARHISELNDHSFFDDLNYAVFKSVKLPFQFDLVESYKGRALFSLNSQLFNGTANMNPLALYDLAHFNFSKVKVFKVNFFYSRNAYYKGYQHNSKHSIRWYSLAVHNPITQLNFTRNFWQSGLIEVDKSCEAVLRLGAEEYMAGLEEIYVDEPIKALAEKEQ